MFKKIKNMVVTALAVLGVLFIILILLPDYDEEEAVAAEDTVEAVQEKPVEEKEEAKEEEKVEKEEAEAADESENEENAVTVNIPQSELSEDALTFNTVSLEGDKASQDIFSGYDITIVHVWGTYCDPCIEEMGDYASLYKELPENVNLVGVVCDVYDGIDRNVSDAEGILKDADAEFLNLRTSDDLYGLTSSLQSVPATFFVDGKGHMIGSMLYSEGADKIKDRLSKYLK
ncbi:MAG: TlpA family protein disulfide reductase [Butyrivibrio sp.]|nr:TlpA family protein disulfide reductase [Butyrivibrio sp.]